MSVSRAFVWFCNECAKVEHKTDYGLPAGWKWHGGLTRQNGAIWHTCDICSEDYEEEK